MKTAKIVLLCWHEETNACIGTTDNQFFRILRNERTRHQKALEKHVANHESKEAADHEQALRVIEFIETNRVAFQLQWAKS